MQNDRQRKTWSVRRPLVLGVATVGVLLTVFGTWATLGHIAGAVIGIGVIEVSTTRTVVQHPIGGVVVDILKRNGDRAEAGEVLLRLDDRDLRSALNVTEGALFETLANIRGGRRDPRVSDPPRPAAAPARRPVHRHRNRNAASNQTEAQIGEVEAQLEAQEDEQAILAVELARARELSGQGLIRVSELTTLEKANAAIRGEIGRLEAQIAELRGRITEAGLKRVSVTTDTVEIIGVELSRGSAPRSGRRRSASAYAGRLRRQR